MIRLLRFAIRDILPLRCACNQQQWQQLARGWFTALFAERNRPAYPSRPQQAILGSVEVTDNFSWLSDYDQARPYLHQEQVFFGRSARAWLPLAQQVAQEVKQNLQALLYNPHGQDTILRCSREAPERQQALLSEDLLHQDAAHLHQLTGLRVQDPRLGTLKLSQDHSLLAYSIFTSEAADQCCCIVKDLRTGALIPNMVLHNVDSFEWSADGTCLYYTTPDDVGRPNKVFRRLMMAPAASARSDALVYHESDARHFITLTRTKDWQYVLINTHAKLSSEVHLLDAYSPASSPVCVQPRTPGLEYFVEHLSGHFIILANLQPHTQPQSPAEGHTQQEPQHSPGTADYSLYSLAAAAAGQEGVSSTCWQLLLPEVPERAITDLDVFDGCVVLHEMQGARPGLRLLHVKEAATGQLTVSHQQQVPLPDWAHWFRPGINQDYHSSTFRLYASSPAQPEVPVEVFLSTGSITQLQHNRSGHQQQQQPQQWHQHHHATAGKQVETAWRPESGLGLTCKQLWATAADGVQIPITLVHRQDVAYDGQSPLLVEVYGAYGHVLEADFKAHRLPLLHRGWSVALAHVRGGGELGRRWHAGGRQLQKRNSLSDLLACLQHLVALGVTQPGRIAGHAASAGGLTLAAAINAQPDWFSAAVLEAPFVDWVAGAGAVTATGEQLDRQHLLTEHEVDEWGDPQQHPAVAELISSMCPYTNLRPDVCYPPLLLTAGLRDTRVPFWMPLKYVAKLRSLQEAHAGAGSSSTQSEVLLDFAEDAGHFSKGISGSLLEDVALQLAFFLSFSELR